MKTPANEKRLVKTSGCPASIGRTLTLRPLARRLEPAT
jgi:hypothetical protein